jgi:L-asparagine oxygenase
VIESVPTTEYALSDAEVASLLGAIADLRTHGLSPVDPEFFSAFSSVQELLPKGLRRFLSEFRRREPGAACMVTGFPVDETAVGSTPEHWERHEGLDATIELDIFVAMCAMALGEPFCWASLQYGRMLQDVFPIKGDEQRPSGHGSDAFLECHTDDAFRPDTCDYLLLFTIRNPDQVPTYVASIRDVLLSGEHRCLLAEPNFYIAPDDEHIRQLMLRAPQHEALRHAIKLRHSPEPVPLLFGDLTHPYVRLDVPFMRCASENPKAQEALYALLDELERVRRPYVPEQGTLLIIDNLVAVHARESFKARYDGTDRWLRKMIVSRGRRKWSADSLTPSSRVVL